MAAAGRLTVVTRDDAAKALADSLKKIFVKEKTEDVERADRQEDRNDPDLR
jgi:hypothetical protein